jgi:phosphatidylserine decarboxylase
MSTPLRRALSLAVGWLADRRVPHFLRGPLYRGFARFTGANLSEVRGPLEEFPSLGAFFVRRLNPGVRPIDSDPSALVSPVDARVQTLCRIEEDTILQAKGHPYSVRDLLAGVGADIDLEGGHAWTLYLGPKDYHRIHAPENARLTEARWVQGCRYSVAAKVLDRRRVLDVNERCVLRMESERGPLLLVLVGALNVGRIRVQGVDPTESGVLNNEREVKRGEELARFELGSTIVLLTPPGMAQPLSELVSDTPVRLGQAIGRYS